MSLGLLYQELKNAVSSVTDVDTGGAIQFVDLFNDQTQKEALTDQLTSDPNGSIDPVVFIQFKDSEFMHLKNGVQRRTLTVCFHVVAPIFSTTGKDTSDEAISRVFNIMTGIHRVVSNLKVTFPNNPEASKLLNFTNFVRVKEEQYIDSDTGEDSADQNFDRLFTQIMSYETVMIDLSGANTRRHDLKEIHVLSVASENFPTERDPSTMTQNGYDLPGELKSPPQRVVTIRPKQETEN